MNCSPMVRKAALLGASLLSIALPVIAPAGTMPVVSDTTWNVYELNADGTKGPWLGLAQTVCLNPTNPSNCQVPGAPPSMVYGYPSPGWTANLSSLPAGARWIWAPNITGATTPAALRGFTFETDFHVCDPPVGGTISVAVDNSAEVSLNGTLVPNSVSTSQSAIKTFTVPASSLFGSSLLSIRKNTLTVTASNAGNPADCGSDEYRCNPAGLVVGARFEVAGDPPCNGFKGGTYENGRTEELSKCSGDQVGSIFHRCVCGTWLPNENTCMSPPPTCIGNNGIRYGVNDSEPVACPQAMPVGSASRKCVAKDTWGSPDTSQCRPAAVTCLGNGGVSFPVNAQENVGACPPPRTVGSRSRTCKPDGTWAGIVETCSLPEICVGQPPGTCVCKSAGVDVGTCPPGVECQTHPIGPILRSSDWYCGAPPPRELGEGCAYNGTCASGYCDRGDGTSKTGRCMPKLNTGTINDWCSNNNQCASGRCGGLHQTISGAWEPGHCSSNAKSALGQFCSFNDDCASAYCDRGNGTSKTSRCMPTGAGASGDWCSNHNQCSSRSCAGLQGLPDGSWQPGHCN